MKESVYSICDMCTVRCPIKVDIEDGVVKWIEGNPNDPDMAGRLCAKDSAGLRSVHNPIQLNRFYLRKKYYGRNVGNTLMKACLDGPGLLFS